MMSDNPIAHSTRPSDRFVRSSITRYRCRRWIANFDDIIIIIIKEVTECVNTGQTTTIFIIGQCSLSRDNLVGSSIRISCISIILPTMTRCCDILFLFVLVAKLLDDGGVFVSAALTNPGFWDTTQEELDGLVEASRPYLMPFERMGNGVKHCNVLPGYEEEQAYKLTNVSVIIMDETLLCQDFPSTCDLTTLQKEHWIIDKAGWFSSKHIAKGINPDIPYDEFTTVTARRPCAGVGP